MAVNRGETGYERRPVEWFELAEFTAVHDPGYDLMSVYLCLQIRAEYAAELFRVANRLRPLFPSSRI